MRQLLIIAAVLALSLADSAAPAKEEKVEAEVPDSEVQGDRGHDYHYRRDDDTYGHRDTLDKHADRQLNEIEQDIVNFVYSPDFYEPTTVLDYRYLKSGGRKYVRGWGGQVLILPKGVEPKGSKDYDTLIEVLRRKSLKERLPSPADHYKHDVYDDEH